VLTFKLMRSFNRWMKTCLDRSVICGFMSTLSTTRCRVFSVIVGIFWYKMPCQHSQQHAAAYFPLLLEYPGTECHVNTLNNTLPRIFRCCWNILVQNAIHSSPYEQKKNGMRSGERAGQVLGPLQIIQRPECTLLSGMHATIALSDGQPTVVPCPHSISQWHIF
jgi:hypothetical protein